jgi:hypothetical protein
VTFFSGSVDRAINLGSKEVFDNGKALAGLPLEKIVCNRIGQEGFLYVEHED